MKRSRDCAVKRINVLAMAFAVFVTSALPGALAAEVPFRENQAVYLIHGLTEKASLNDRWPPNFVALLDAKIGQLGDSYRVFALDYPQTKTSNNYTHFSALKLKERKNSQWVDVPGRSYPVESFASTNLTRLGNLIKQSMEQELDPSYDVSILALSYGGYIARDYVVEQMHDRQHLENMTRSITFIDHPHLGSAEYLKKYEFISGVFGDVEVGLPGARGIACGLHLLCTVLPSRCGSYEALECAAANRLELWDSWANTNDNSEGRYKAIEWTNLYGAGPVENPAKVTLSGVVSYDLPPGRTDDPGKDEFRSCTVSGGNSRLGALDGDCSSENNDFSSAHRVKSFDHNIELPFYRGKDHHGAGSTLRKKRSLRQLGFMQVHLFGDVDADGDKDLVEFDDIGVRVHLALPPGESVADAEVPGFAAPVYWSDQFAYQHGWRYEQNPRYLVDINRDGKQDIVGFGENGLWVAFSTGDPEHVDGGFVQATVLCTDGASSGDCWSATDGYRGDQHPRMVLNLGENSDRVFVVYFTNTELAAGELIYNPITGGVSFGNSRSVWSSVVFNRGARAEKNPRVLADVNGDGWQDVIGFGRDTVSVAEVFVAIKGSPRLSVSDWKYDYYTTDDGGWQVGKHPRLLADVNGDGSDDLVGFADSGPWVSLSRGSSFGPHSRWLDDLGILDNWDVDDYDSPGRKRTDRFLRDVTGDGMADIVAYDEHNKLFLFASNGVDAFIEEPDVSAYPQLRDAMQGISGGAPLNYERFLVDIHGDGFVRLVSVATAESKKAKAQEYYEQIDRDADGIPDSSDFCPSDPNVGCLPPGC